jgi:hypothetical protein
MSDPADRSRVVRLFEGLERRQVPNHGTRFEPVALDHRLSVEHALLFNAHQAALARRIRRYARPGVVTFALSEERGVCGELWLEAGEGVRSGSIGRHSAAELFLPWHEALSLRHLLVLVRKTPGGPVHSRVVDLNTPLGFTAETGGRLGSVEADGPLVLSAAGYSLILFPTGGPLAWDPEASDPFATLPTRVHQAAEPSARPDPRPVPRPITRVTPYAAPRPAAQEGAVLCEAGERALGVLVVCRADREEAIPVGARALERGVVLGRYGRCDVGRQSGRSGVSRVHAILLSCDGEPHLVDAGSTNGTYCGDQEIKCARLEPQRTYWLGDELCLRWEPVQ